MIVKYTFPIIISVIRLPVPNIENRQIAYNWLHYKSVYFMTKAAPSKLEIFKWLSFPSGALGPVTCSFPDVFPLHSVSGAI